MDLFYSCLEEGASSLYAIFDSGRLVPTALSILSRTGTGHLDIFIENIRNGTFSPTLYIPHAGSTLSVGLSVCILLMFMSPVPSIAPVTANSVSAGNFSCFASQTVACLLTSRLDALCNSMLDIFDRSLSFHRIGTCSECINTVSLSGGKFLLRYQSIYLVQSRMSTAKFSTFKITCVLLGFPALLPTE